MKKRGFMPCETTIDKPVAPPLTEGYLVKGGRNPATSQIKERPSSPVPLTRSQPTTSPKRLYDAWNEAIEKRFSDLTVSGIPGKAILLKTKNQNKAFSFWLAEEVYRMSIMKKQ